MINWRLVVIWILFIGNYLVMAFKSLGKLLPRQLRQSGIERDVKAAYILTMTNDILDDIFGAGTTANHARAAIFKCKQLKIATTNASLKNAIMFRQQDIIKAVNNKLGEQIVERISVIF